MILILCIKEHMNKQANPFGMLKSLVDSTSSYFLINYFVQYLEEAKKEDYIREYFLYDDIVHYIETGIYNWYKHSEEKYEKVIILDERQKLALKNILIVLCWAFWDYYEEYDAFFKYWFGSIQKANSCLEFLYEFKDWYAQTENFWDYDNLKSKQTNPLYSEVVETIIDSYKEVMNNWNTHMILKLDIDVPYIADDKTYFVKKEIVVEQSLDPIGDEGFFELSLNVDSDTDVLLYWWNAFLFGTTETTKKEDLKKFLLNLVDERFNLKK